MNWSTKTSEPVTTDTEQMLEHRSAYLDLSDSSQSGLKFGEETLFVNAAIVDRGYRPVNAPWVVDLDLPVSMPQSISTPGSEKGDVTNSQYQTE
jgi:hypothetical protein